MKFQAGTKLPMVRLDSKVRRLKCDLPSLPGGKTRCTPLAALRNMIPRPSAKASLVFVTVLLLGFVTFLHVAPSVTTLPVRTIVPKWKYLLGRELRQLSNEVRQLVGINSNVTYTGYAPPFYIDSSECSVSESLEAVDVVPPSSIKSSPTHKFDYDICLAVSIGDDRDVPNEKAIPYPLVSRLTDALKEEAVLWRKQFSEDVAVLVGVDYGSVVCPIVRDTFAELPGVEAECRAFSELELGTTCGKLVVGSSKRFVPQVPEEWSDAVEWQSRRVVDLDCVDPSHQPPALPEKDWRPTVVTGFSSNHMTVGLLLLRSIGKAVEEARKNGSGLDVSVVVWAMEVFDAEHLGLLDCVMNELIHDYGVKAEVRLFDWSAYPSWMRINQNLGYFGGTGEYAWKAIMVHTVLLERGIVLWGDAGDRFHDADSLIGTLKQLNSTGFVSRNSHGYVYTRTHPLHLKYFRANVPEIWDRENCEAAIVGFTLKTYSELARPWYDCSITRQCIAPDGSDRSNHRQDQAALTVLSILAKRSCTGADLKFSHHEDDDPTLNDISGTYLTKCYVDPLILSDQGTLQPEHRPHGIIN